jgi:hypothetical protein
MPVSLSKLRMPGHNCSYNSYYRNSEIGRQATCFRKPKPGCYSPMSTAGGSDPIDNGVPHHPCPAVSNSVNPKPKPKSSVPSTNRAPKKIPKKSKKGKLADPSAEVSPLCEWSAAPPASKGNRSQERSATCRTACNQTSIERVDSRRFRDAWSCGSDKGARPAPRRR